MDSVKLFNLCSTLLIPPKYSPYGCSPYGYSPYNYSPYNYSPYGYSPYGYSPYGYSPYDYSPYGCPPNHPPHGHPPHDHQHGCSPYVYYSDELETIVNKKYGTDFKTQNIDISPITFNEMNYDSYNFKINDRELNILIGRYYHQYYDFVMKNINGIELPNNFEGSLENSAKYEVLKPYNVIDTHDKIKLFFSIDHRSNTFSTHFPMFDKTEFILEELKNINKNKYAYITLFFPGYDSKMNKHYNYLIGTLLVAYMLKNFPQNYSLHRKGKNGTKAKIICMITPDVEQHIIDILKMYYDDVVIVPYITWNENALPKEIVNNKNNYIKINDVSKGNINSMHVYSKVFTKLNIFNKELFPFEKVILLDTDLFPLGHYDTLFSIDAPAGCLEHRRLQINELGIGSWGFDRGQFAKHGKPIPKNLTDIENVFASDVNASLLIIEPNKNSFDEMIQQLQTPVNDWLGEYKEHKGFWLGNRFYDFYFLPEQNYLTKRFSGQWKSVDLGFSTWLLDIDNSFGFTFAGFVVKPWEIQSAFHRYSINPYSQFSKINNKISQKSYGYEVMNHIFYKMLLDIRNHNNIIFNSIKDTININFITKPFDPWEPEFDIRKSHYCRNIKCINDSELKYFSYDQKKLIYLLNDNINKEKLQKILYCDQLLNNISGNIYNLHFTALSYHLTNILFKITDSENIKIYPFGNTFVSFAKYDSFDITDDDNDFIMITNTNSYKQTVINIIKKVLDHNLQVYVSLFSKEEFIQIVRDDIKPLYYYKNDKNKMTFDNFVNKFDFNDFKYFNISYYSPIIEKIMNEMNISTTYDMYHIFKNNNCVKVPWVDIFLIFENDNKLSFKASSKKTVTFTNDIFANKSIFNCMTKKKYLKILKKWIRIQKEDKFIEIYYGDKTKLNKYVIKNKHKSNNTRKIILELDTTNSINDNIVRNLFNYINVAIEELYKTINIDNYLINTKFYE